MSLPKTPQSREGMAPRHARILLGAPAKCLKTTLLGQWAPQTTLIIDTQRGTDMLDGEHYVAHVKDWPGFVRVVDDIVRGGHPFHTVGLDLADDLWRFVDMHYGGTDDGVRIPASGKDDYGRSLKKARAAYIEQINRLLTTPLGIWFTTHLTEKRDRKGELAVYVPDLDKNVSAYIISAVGFVWLAETRRNGDRVIHTQPTQHFEAGSRVLLPSPLPADVRVIATELDKALNPEKYAAKAQPLPAGLVGALAAASDAVHDSRQEALAALAIPAEVEPPRQHVEDFPKTGASDIPDDDPRAGKARPKARPASAIDADMPWDGEEPPADLDLPTLDVEGAST